MSKGRDKSVRTRNQILATAKKLFLRHGYNDTTIEAVLVGSGVSKGALYHHFSSKEALLEAIYRDNSRGAVERAMAAIDVSKPFVEQLREGSHAWLAQIRKPSVAKILLEIGPRGLGSRESRAIEDLYSQAALRDMISRAKDAGELGEYSPEIAARMLNALLAEAAILAVSTSRDLAEALRLIDNFIDQLRA